MSELKIIKGSIQNSILKDGQFVFGEIDCLDTSSGKIYSSSYGAFAHGCVIGDAEIVASGISLYSSEQILEKENGIVINTNHVFMDEDEYPIMWK